MIVRPELVEGRYASQANMPKPSGNCTNGIAEECVRGVRSDSHAGDTGPASRRVRSEVRRAVRTHQLSGATIVAAVSGGPDSLALVHALAQLRDSLGIRLYAAHLNHGLRPGESESDAEFVREAMGELQVPLFSEKADVSHYREKHRLSLEDAARQVRYSFLARVYGAGRSRCRCGWTQPGRSGRNRAHARPQGKRPCGTQGDDGYPQKDRRRRPADCIQTSAQGPEGGHGRILLRERTVATIRRVEPV